MTATRTGLHVRYRIARTLIHVGLNVMPDCRYRRELLDLLRDLRARVEHAVEGAGG